LVAHFQHFSLFPHFRISALPLQVKSYARIKP